MRKHGEEMINYHSWDLVGTQDSFVNLACKTLRGQKKYIEGNGVHSEQGLRLRRLQLDDY